MLIFFIIYWNRIYILLMLVAVLFMITLILTNNPSMMTATLLGDENVPEETVRIFSGMIWSRNVLAGIVYLSSMVPTAQVGAMATSYNFCWHLNLIFLHTCKNLYRNDEDDEKVPQRRCRLAEVRQLG